MSTARNRDMVCHTCGGKGHFKRDCPNRKVMIINEDNEYETGDDVDPNAPDDDDYDTDGEDAYPSDARTIVVSQRSLNVLPSASTQRCNLFQTKALVGPDKACKWLSDNGEMKVNHMVRVEFAIGPYKDCIDFDVVPMTEFGDVFPEEVPAGLPPLRGIEHQIELIPGASLPNRAPYRTNPEETKEIQKHKRYSTKESHAGGLMGHFGREKTLLMLADHFYWPKMRRDVDRYVKRCITCNKSKSKMKPHGTSVKTQAMESKPMEKELEMMKMELQRTGRNFRPPGPELPDSFRCAKMPSSAQRSGASRNFRPVGPELPPGNFRPSSAQVPKVRQNALEVTGNGLNSELDRNLAGTSGRAGTSALQDRNFPAELPPSRRNFRHRDFSTTLLFSV
ncbi:hypothetical protein QYE76_066554 [Lolium multiflorum]|uniref:CCHC-type domain-containing protein n=1 Tax=Lolium multiflorum TaxID=4521 RepID=A0AAD8SB35_LOLMU|nr:hypothetical protein QYE76_066554 [Lolium multiflorum]